MKVKQLSILFFIIFFISCNDNEIEPENPEEEPEKKASFVIVPDSIDVVKGHSYQLSAEFNGKIIDNKEVNWFSVSDIVSVDANGIIMAYRYMPISCNIRASYQGYDAYCKVTVYDEYDYKLRLHLKDKGSSQFTTISPEEYLSAKSIERRRKQNIAITETDLPISEFYIEEIEKIGGKIIAKSKWLNTVTVFCEKDNLTEQYKKLPFIENVILVGQTSSPEDVKLKGNETPNQKASSSENMDSGFYGGAWYNINTNNGQVLHNIGFKGDGIDIAVIDAGFENIKTNSSLNSMKIKGAKSFIFEKKNPYQDTHGIWVSSCMGANIPNYYVGTAPNANYWLLRTEDSATEQPVEEDYWVAAIEFADSAGVDIVNSSLYYTGYNYPFHGYRFENMDGKTAFATRGANMAFDKGIFVVNCAGNDQTWVGTPADSPNVLTVGAINRNKNIDTFTSYGQTVDGRMKPDIVALGGGAGVIDVDGRISYRSGTSYASPNMCGLIACLWQAYPQLTNKELLDIIKKSADRYDNPVLPYGYGIVDMEKAISLISTR